MENNLQILCDVTKHLTECWIATKEQGIGSWSGIYGEFPDLYHESVPATFQEVYKKIISNCKTYDSRVIALESIACDLSELLRC